MDGQLSSVSLATHRTRLETMKSYQEQLDKLLRKELSYHTRISVQILQDKVRTFVEGYPYKGYLLPVAFSDSPLEGLRILISFMKFENEQDFRNLLSRYAAFPRKIDEIIELCRKGIEENIVLHRVSVETFPAQLRALDGPVEDSVYFRPFLKLDRTVVDPVRSELDMKGRQAVKLQVLAQALRLADFIESEYLPRTRPSIGVSSLPGGTDLYQAYIRFHTSTDLTAEQIHQMGLEEVERIEGEMMKIAKSQGFRGENISEYSEQLRSDPSNYFDSKQAMIAAFEDEIQNRIQKQLPSVVWKLPEDDVIVEFKPPHLKKSAAASYRAPAFDGSQPGKFLINGNIFNQTPRYEVPALALHETNPGHHLYFSTIVRNTGLPKFRRVSGDMIPHTSPPSALPNYNAIMEGWALYAEFLGEAMTIYEGRPIERYGGYNLEIYRAARLVVDTGLHALNWTQEEAVDYMLQHTASTRIRLENEVRRYITWPGQALSYKIGELRLKEMRRRAIQRLTSKFDLRTFHQVVLDCAGPLTVVESCVNKYISDDGDWVKAWTASGAAPTPGVFACVISIVSLAVGRWMRW